MADTHHPSSFRKKTAAEKRGTSPLKIAIITLLLVAGSAAVRAQFDGIYSQYGPLKYFYNAAAIGEQEMMRALVAQRLDWIGIKNAPKTTYFSVNTPFAVRKTNHAAGIQFVSDVFGVFANQQINAQYAYKFKFEYGTLSLGANIGLINIICNGDSIHLAESDYHSPNDPAIPTGTQSGVGFDLGAGAYFSNARFYAGISVQHIPGSNIKLGDKYDFKVGQLMTILGGYNISLPNKDYQLRPSAFIYTDFRSWQAHLMMLLDYKHKYWGGLGYSIERAVSLNFGAQIINGLEIGYCYDIPASAMIRATHGSHEIYISYDFNVFRPKTNQKHKSVRYL